MVLTIERTSRFLCSSENKFTALTDRAANLESRSRVAVLAYAVQHFLQRADSMHPWRMLKDCPLARMSDGHYCLLRDLGPVKSAKGMKHHEVVIDFRRRGLLEAFRRLISRKRPPE
jgi:hypothetical protein